MKSILVALLLILLPSYLAAEVAYIANKLEVGLHEDKSLQSAIVKIVSSGTRLEILKREQRLAYVKEPNGAAGWIDLSYLTTDAPNNLSLDDLQARSDKLETRLAESKSKVLLLESELKKQGKVLPTATIAFSDLKIAHAELNQKLKAEIVKVGELQIELTALRKRVGQDSDSDTLYRRIDSLEEDNKKLEIQLANTLDRYEADGLGNLRAEGNPGDGFNPGARNMVIYLVITLVLGLFAGAYLLDFINRRRHGGFRI